MIQTLELMVIGMINGIGMKVSDMIQLLEFKVSRINFSLLDVPIVRRS